MTNLKLQNNNDVSPKSEAQRLYFNRHTVAEISRKLSVPATTIYTWVEKEKWAQYECEDKIAFVIESRLIELFEQSDWTGAEKQKIDFLQRQLEQTRKTKAKFQFDTISEGAVAGRKEKRESAAKKSDKNNATTEQIEKLKELFLNLIFDYQKTWFSQKDQRNRFILKSRQIGATYYFAMEALIDAFETGRNKIFISASRAQANIFKNYMINFANEVGLELKGGDCIILGNKAELHFLGTNYRTAQGLHGDLYLDEVFWIYGFSELYKVASGMSSHKKWHRTLMSTPSTINHEAYELWSGSAKNKDINISYAHLKNGFLDVDRIWRHIVTIMDAIDGGCDLFDLEELQDEYSKEDFGNLFGCEFIDDTESVFNLSTMMRCFVDSWTAWTDVKPFNKRPYNGKVWIGYDPNGGEQNQTGKKKNDPAAVVVFTEPKNHDDKIRILETARFENGQDFEIQSNFILKLCDKYHVTHIGIDKTGVGAGVAQLIKKAKPAITTVYQYSAELKFQMVMKTQNVMSKNRLQYDAGENDITKSFMTIRSINGKYVSLRGNGAGHGDIAWAFMNAIIHESLDKNSKNKSDFEAV